MRKRIRTKRARELGYRDYEEYLDQRPEQPEPAEANPDVLPESPEEAEDMRALKLKAIDEAELTEYERLIINLIERGTSVLSIAAKLERSPSSINSAIRQAKRKIHRTYARLSLIYRMKGEA